MAYLRYAIPCMTFTAGELYHIYNRGNNKNKIFFSPRNYNYFLKKVKKYICPNCNILNFDLMPNHFHFLICANEKTEERIRKGFSYTNPLSEGFRKLLSNYTKGINIQENRTGSLFQQNTKAKCLEDPEYPLTCFHYIHQNPLIAGLVKRMEDWPYSSFNDYLGNSDYSICNKELAIQYLDIDMQNFYKDSYEQIEDNIINQLF